MRYAEKHTFLDMTAGLRIEDEQIEDVKGQLAYGTGAAVLNFDCENARC